MPASSFRSVLVTLCLISFASCIATAQVEVKKPSSYGSAFSSGALRDAQVKSPAILAELVASLHPKPGLVWQRTSPTAQKPEGPVLYQLLFSTAGTPDTIAMFDTNPRHLTNSLLSQNGSTISIAGALTVGATSIANDGTITFKPGQAFPIVGTNGGTVTSIAAGPGITGGTITAAGTLGLDTTFTDARYLQQSGGTVANLNVTGGLVAATLSGNGSALANVNASNLGGQPIGYFPRLAGGNNFSGNTALLGNNLSILPSNQATAVSTGFTSGGHDLLASTWSTAGTAQSMDQLFRLQVMPMNGGTPAPTGQLHLLTQKGHLLCDPNGAPGAACNNANPVDTGFYFNSDGTMHFATAQTLPLDPRYLQLAGGTMAGLINFANGQTFPGSAGGGTVTSITAGTGLTAVPNPIVATGTISIANGGVTTAQISSGAAANGNVLTANGAGGTSWQPSSGGGNFLPLTGGNLTGPETITVPTPGISGLFVTQSSTNATGINVQNTATGVTTISNAIYSQTNADNGVGVFGNAVSVAAGSSSTGVYGASNGPSGTGVGGAAMATTGNATGVRGTTASATGIGVVGSNSAASGAPAYGVFGSSVSPNGTGVYGTVSSTADTANNNGVQGVTASPVGIGVNGLATDTTGGSTKNLGSVGVNGQSNSPNGIGVIGFASDATPVVVGTTPNQGTIGVQAQSNSPAGTGLFAFDNYQCLLNALTPCDPSVLGAPAPTGIFSQVLHANGVAVFAQAGNGKGCALPACDPTKTGNVGVLGITTHPNGVGLYGIARDTSVTNTANRIFAVGVIGQARQPTGYALYANFIPATVDVGAAALFNNDAGFTPPNTPGTLCKGVAACTILELQANRTRMFHFDGAGNAHAAGTFVPGGADFAESVSVRGERRQYDAGDVMVIDESGNRSLAMAHEQYSTLVAGIVSTKPGVLASLHNSTATAGLKAMENEVPLAVVGIVPCKVTAENGAIHAGDLLVTSATPGYAMKGTDRSRMLGAVVGKAMQPLLSGQGVIEVLVTLQ